MRVIISLIKTEQKIRKGDDKMTSKNYKELLKKRCENEYDQLMEEMKQLPTDVIINRSYERIIKSDMLACIVEGFLSQEESEALLCYEKPLEYIYAEWLHNSLSCLDVMRTSLNLCANIAVKEMKARRK